MPSQKRSRLRRKQRTRERAAGRSSSLGPGLSERLDQARATRDKELGKLANHYTAEIRKLSEEHAAKRGKIWAEWDERRFTIQRAEHLRQEREADALLKEVDREAIAT